MLIETCGTTFDTAAIVAKQRAGRPLTFGEEHCLKYGGTPVAASPPGATVAKFAPVTARATVLAIAAKMRADNPKLTESAAMIAAIDSNAELATRYRAEQPSSAGRCDQWTTKSGRERPPEMSAKRQRVEELAWKLHAEKGVTIEQARSRIWEAYPALRE